MANQFKQDLTDRYVILKNDYIYLDSAKGIVLIGDPSQRVFKCRGGSGCKPYTNGTLISGTIVSTNMDMAIRGYDYMERIATDEEIAEAKSLRETQ
jgi:hypothetical protein